MPEKDGASPDGQRSLDGPRSQCGMSRAAMLLGDRWTLLILREALFGVTRFDAIQSALSCPRSVLSSRLKTLCAEGVLTTRPYREKGQRPRRQYVLTRKGVDLALPMIALMHWGERHCVEGAPLAQLVERKSGAPARVALISKAGEPIGPGDVQLQKNAAL